MGDKSFLHGFETTELVFSWVFVCLFGGLDCYLFVAAAVGFLFFPFLSVFLSLFLFHIFCSVLFPLKRCFNGTFYSMAVYMTYVALLSRRTSTTLVFARKATLQGTNERRLLQSFVDSFFAQMVEETAGKGVMLDQERSGWGCEGWRQSGCSDHKMVEFRIMGGSSKVVSRIATLDFRRTNFDLFGDLLGGA